MTKGKQVINILIWLSILTSSFDIFLTIELFGLTIRASQIIMIVVMFAFLIEFVMGKARIASPTGFGWLVLCVFLNTIFCFNSLSFANAVGYDLWFVFDALQILVIVYYFKKTETLEGLTKKYIYCFVILAVVGLLQVALQYVGINFFVTQENNMHRANGFSYEPSYYATYMLIGWCICMYLFEKENYSVISKNKLTIFTILTTLAMILSTSRMGWVMMVLYMGVRLLVNLKLVFSRRMNRWKIILIAFIILLAVGLIFIFYGISVQNATVMKYLNGLGIGGTPSHSSSDRINRLIYTLQVFFKNPIIGVSLGGVDPAVCYDILGLSELTNGTAMCVFAEVLAGLGIFGFIFFLIYLCKLVFGYRKIKFFDESHKQIGVSFVLALVFILLILQMNQNILRPVLWVHIALLSAIYSMEKSKII